MVIIKDADGNTIDLSKVLTICMPVNVTGSLGSTFFFEMRHQYLFEDTSTRVPETALQDDYGDVAILHYRIERDGEDFYIPGPAAVIEMMLRPWYHQDRYGFLEWNANQPRDFIGEYKELTGIDLKKRASPQYDGYDLMEEMEKQKNKDQGKKYGERKLDSEEYRRNPA